MRVARPVGSHVAYAYPRRVGVVIYTVRQGTLDGEIVGTYRHPGTYEPAIDDVIVVEERQWRVADLLSVEPSQDPDYNTLVVERVEAANDLERALDSVRDVEDG